MSSHDAVIGRVVHRACRAAGSRAVSLLLAVVASAAPSAEAATKVWNSAAGGNWSAAANWTGGLPGPGDDVDITLPGTYTVTLDTNTFSLRSLVLGGASGTQTLAIAANTLQIGFPFTGTVTTVNANGVILLSGGTIDLSTNGPNALQNFGTIIHAGGSATIYAENATVTNAAGGKIDVQSGTLHFVGSVFSLIGGTLQNAGTLTIESSTNPGLAVSGWAYFVNTGTVLLNSKFLHIDLGGHFEQSAGVTDLGTPNGTLFNNGAPLSVTGGAVTGNGTIVGDVSISGSAAVAPGASPGRISFAGAYQQSGGAFVADLNGTDPGVTYDQIQVSGAVTLAGTLTTNLGFAPTVGTVFVILDNQGAGAISGAFTGLPEGATIAFGTTTLRISYVGGTGNDVTLTVVAGVPGTTSTTLTATPNPSVFGQSVTLTATVTGASPTGTMQFKDGAANLGAPVALAAGTATLATSALSVAPHPITAVYGGDANNLPSTSSVVTEVVNSAAAQPIPTLRDRILVLLALLQALLGAGALRRRNRRHG